MNVDTGQAIGSGDSGTVDARKPKSHLKVTLKMLGLAVGMFGFGYLMVPMYNIICDITGLNGKTGVISTAQASQMKVNTDRKIKVEFTSSINQRGAWEFRPDQPSMMVHPGKPYTMTFVATNKQNKAVTSQSVPSVTPNKAAAHFDKMECFCFTEQKFDALEKREMPVTFVVGAAVPADVDTITLSYTLFTKDSN